MYVNNFNNDYCHKKLFLPLTCKKQNSQNKGYNSFAHIDQFGAHWSS